MIDSKVINELYQSRVDELNLRFTSDRVAIGDCSICKQSKEAYWTEGDCVCYECNVSGLESREPFSLKTKTEVVQFYLNNIKSDLDIFDFAESNKLSLQKQGIESVLNKALSSLMFNGDNIDKQYNVSIDQHIVDSIAVSSLSTQQRKERMKNNLELVLRIVAEN